MLRKTPLGQVLGLGSAKSGTEHWWAQRLTAVAGVPLVVFFVGFILAHRGATRAEVLASMQNPLVAILLALGKFHSPGDVGARTWLFLVLSGLATGASWICYFRALKVGDASLVAPVDKLSVVLVAVFGVTLLGERLSLLQWGGVALVGAGAVLLVVSG